MGNYKRRFGDRYDGRLVRSVDPFFRLIPYIMKTRADSQVFFDEKIDLNNVEEYLRTKRNAGVRDIGFLHVVIAAIVRTISQKPGLNRFVAGQKIYSRNEIIVSLAVKKQLLEESPETTIKLKFKPTDTIFDIVKTINKAVEENKQMDTSNDTDKTAKIVALCPGFFIKFIVWFLSTLDYFRIMPKIIYEASPFHTSVFVTDLGSLGIQPVYHHIYNFGTTSIFVAFGNKQREKVLDNNNNVVERKYINVRVVADERIVDGHYYANAFKLFRRLMTHPERLETAPERVVEDIQ
jgi:Pyruvate/2-oxoglutarate dehydrogenase complex, dihydrolipoamide acyltransferase (E2) component, and related enzymes